MRGPIGRPRSIGLAVGALWLTAVCAPFAIWSLIAIGTPEARGVLIGVLVATAALVATSVLVIRAASHLPASTAPRTVEERATGRWFALVVGAEVAALVVVNPVAAATGHVELMPSLNLMIVGLHFLPLAWIFRVPRYYVMGVLFCGIPAGMMLSISADTLVGHPPAWYVIPSLGCGLVAGLTAMAGLREAWQSVVGLRPVLPTLS